MRRRLLLLLLVLVQSFASSAFALEAPDALVERTANQLLASALADETATRSDPERLNRVVETMILAHVDEDTLARLTLGRYWRQASAAQQQRFIHAYRRVLVKSYVLPLSGKLHELRDSRIAIVSSRVDPDGGSATVRTQVRQPGTQTTPVDYFLHVRGNEWKIFDVSVSGIGVVNTFRQTFNEQIRRDGFEAFLQKLEALGTGRTPS